MNQYSDHHMNPTPALASLASLVVGLLAAACASERAPAGDDPLERGATERTTTTDSARQDQAPVPGPGVDLAGPIETIDMGAIGETDETGAPAASERQVEVLDLGTDRVAQPIDTPRPPRGGAVPFTFADHGKGWIARVPDSRQLPAAAYGDGKVYISGGFDSVTFYAMDAVTGQFQWATTNLEDNGPTAAVYQDDRVIFNTESCTLFVLDADTGERIWYKYLGDPTLAQAAVADGLVFAAHPADQGTRLSAYKVKNGARVWSRRISGELLATPVVHGDSVYASTIHGVVYRFVRASGERVWKQRMKATTAPWIDGEELFISRKQGKDEQQVVASIATGEILREHQSVAGRYLWDVPRNLDDWRKVWEFEGSRPVIDRGIRYVAMGGEIHATDAHTGEPRWMRRYAEGAGKRSVGTVALAGPQVVIATRDGQVFGLDVDTGYTLWAYDVDHEIVAEPIVAKGWVYLTSKQGYVIGLEVGDATLDGWHMFGGNPGHNGPVRADSPVHDA